MGAVTAAALLRGLPRLSRPSISLFGDLPGINSPSSPIFISIAPKQPLSSLARHPALPAGPRLGNHTPPDRASCTVSMGQQASLPQPGTSIQVIGAGLSRTGTASFSRALEILLNGPIYHCGTQSTMGPPYQVQRWIQILRHWLSGSDSERSTMLRLLQQQTDGYAAITDAPGTQFVPELMELYPDAKVICTVRDPISWEKSFAQVMNITGLWFLPWVLLPVPGMINYFRYLTLLGEQWKQMYGESRPTRQTYVRHIEWLKEVVPEDRLVFFDVKEGWEPLCKALGKDIPHDQPFPHVNDSEAVDKIARYHVRRGLTRWAVMLAVGAAGVAIFWRR